MLFFYLYTKFKKVQLFMLIQMYGKSSKNLKMNYQFKREKT